MGNIHKSFIHKIEERPPAIGRFRLNALRFEAEIPHNPCGHDCFAFVDIR